MPFLRNYNSQSTKQIALISLISLLLGHLMITTYVPSVAINLLGLVITSYFIFYNTLRKNDSFSFVMVIYFCSFFPYLLAKGGGFNLVVFVCIGFFIISKGRLPFETRIMDIWFKVLVGLFILSSILGWIFNYTGKGPDFVYSFLTFFGIIFILLLSSSLAITYQRIKVFIQLNIILIIYSTIGSINKYLQIIPFKTPMMPVSGGTKGPFQGGGTMGISPFYGEYSMILFILFLVFFMLSRKTVIKRITLFVSAFIAFINIFMSISRSVFLLALGGLLIIIIFQFKFTAVKIQNQILRITLILLFGFCSMLIINRLGLGYVFTRLDEIQDVNRTAGGVSVDRILEGSAFNRETAFTIAKERYKSKESWLIGYGWGLTRNNRDAFFVNPQILRTSPHSQIFAILFLFGWIGLFAYFGMIFRLIQKSYRTMSNRNIDHVIRMFSFFFMISFCLFTLNEIKADSLYSAGYFAVTIIWLGLGYATSNAANRQVSMS